MKTCTIASDVQVCGVLRSFIHKMLELHFPIGCLLLGVLLSMVPFSTMRFKTVLGYTCQDKDWAVLSHVFPGFDVDMVALCRFCTFSIFGD